MSAGKLPEGWVQCELSLLGNIVTGKTPSTKEPSYFSGDIPFIKPGDLEFGGNINKTTDTLTEKGLAVVPTLPPNSIVVTCIGNLGKVGITTKRSATNQQINSLIPNKRLCVKFIYYQMLTLKPWLESQSVATTIAIVNKGRFSQAPIKLPTAAEQKIIAEKLDTLLAQADGTKARLEQIPQILKRFRQAVLNAAVTGTITQDMQSTPGRRVKYLGLNIPNEWLICQISDISDVKGGKRLPKGETLTSENTGHPYIRAGQLKNGTVQSEDQLYLQPSTQKLISRYIVSAGDIYITIVGACIGDAGIIPEYYHNANLTENAAKICNIHSNVLNKYLSIWLRSSHLQDIIHSEIKSGAQGKLALARIKTLPLILPPLPEQHEIVRRVEQLFAYADTIEKQVNNALARVNNLTQSILAKAFRGELTAQWRAENPELISGENSAAALLEKIKAERAASGGKKASRKKS